MKTILILCALCVMGYYPNDANPYLQTLQTNLLARQYIHGYLEPRPGAHFFYWFYYASGKIIGSNQKPLIIWIQGGPGIAASGVGNFCELGPLNMQLQPRNHTWVKGRNVLLIDHPAGVGFSYVTNNTLLVKTDREVALDLCRVIKLFFRKHKEYRKTPTYVFGQSYGGKMTPRLAVCLHTAIKKKRIRINFKGIGIGGGWVNPKESTLSQPDFLYHSGIIDRDVYLNATGLTRKLAHFIDIKNYIQANSIDSTYFEKLNQDVVINFNNVKLPSPYPALRNLDNTMNVYVKPILHNVKQSIHWEFLSETAYNNLRSNFLIPSTAYLEKLLNETDLKIVVYNGNLDAVTPLAAASNWIHKLRWSGTEEFSKVKRLPIAGTRNGYYKQLGKLSLWSVFEAGHWVPEENPEAMADILNYITKE